ncbi:MAG: hypothetical protein J0H67_23865 [Rhodospirillales bacterium]|nr:hypothetical protein [Rhodospirillales bacterium]
MGLGFGVDRDWKPCEFAQALVPVVCRDALAPKRRLERVGDFEPPHPRGDGALIGDTIQGLLRLA